MRALYGINISRGAAYIAFGTRGYLTCAYVTDVANNMNNVLSLFFAMPAARMTPSAASRRAYLGDALHRRRRSTHDGAACA